MTENEGDENESDNLVEFNEQTKEFSINPQFLQRSLILSQ